VRLLRTRARYATAGRRPRVLIVEDDPAQRQVVRTALESEGYAVDESPYISAAPTCASSVLPWTRASCARAHA
jgi:PleD family two-component response regulator